MWPSDASSSVSTFFMVRTHEGPLAPPPRPCGAPSALASTCIAPAVSPASAFTALGFPSGLPTVLVAPSPVLLLL
eukprot:1161053-Pelagomonas_calceolata.AAC.21